MYRKGSCIYFVPERVYQRKVDISLDMLWYVIMEKLNPDIMTNNSNITLNIAVVHASIFCQTVNQKVFDNITHHASWLHYYPFARIRGTHNIALHRGRCYASHKCRSSLNGLIKILGLLGAPLTPRYRQVEAHLKIIPLCVSNKNA